MNPELRELLLLLAVTAPIGLILGITLRKTKPQWCRSWSRYSQILIRSWWTYAMWILLFSGLALFFFMIHRPYHGGLFLALVALEIFVLIRHGPLSGKAIIRSQVDS